ncbi:MAG: hypothetical protein ACRDYZ_10770 [Acidimicrobiales bacterium]
MIAYTIVSRAYLAHARVLARSYSQHHPGERLVALLVDDVDREVDQAQEPFAVLRLTQLGTDMVEVHRMAMLFGSRLIAAIKPWVFRHMLDEAHDSVVYIDSDIAVYDKLDPLGEAATDGVVLVPHVLSPVPRDGRDPDETRLLGVGQYNAGLFGTGPDSGGFVSFLQERLRRECRFDVAAMRVNEQRWLDFVPPLFPCRVVRDPGIDVAYWNLHERPLSRHGDTVFAGGGPLRCFHFSSFDPRMHSIAGRYEVRASPRVRRAADPLLDELCTDYAERLFAAGFDDVHRIPFAFDHLADATPVYDSLRALYARDLAVAEAGPGPLPPDPFDPGTVGELRAWAQDAYGRAEIQVPRLLRDDAASAPPPVHGAPSFPVPAVDWLGSLERGPVAIPAYPAGGVRDGADAPKVARTSADLAGFVLFGPRAQLDPGDYRLTVELEVRPRPPGVPADEQALIAEVYVDGYVTGATAATFDDLDRGALTVTFSVPTALLDGSLLDGVELRLLSRGRVDLTVGAVLVECTSPAPHSELEDLPLPQWLPFMAAGEAGQRKAGQVHLVAGDGGVAAYGPNWRLPPGPYLVTVQVGGPARVEPSDPLPRSWRRRALARRSEQPALDGPQVQPVEVAVVEVMVGDRVLARQSLTSRDVKGPRELPVEITADDAGPDDRVGVRITSVAPDAGTTGRVIEAVAVRRRHATGRPSSSV